jgi:hypothetical protein
MRCLCEDLPRVGFKGSNGAAGMLDEPAKLLDVEEAARQRK